MADVRVSNNTIVDNGGYGVNGTGSASLLSTGVKLLGNTINRNLGGGVTFSYLADCTIDGNTIIDNSAVAGGQKPLRLQHTSRCRLSHNTAGYAYRTSSATLMDSADATNIDVLFSENNCVNPGLQTCIALAGNAGGAVRNTANGSGNVVNSIGSASNMVLEKNYVLTPNFSEAVANTGYNNAVILKNPDVTLSSATAVVDSIGHTDLISTNASGTTSIALANYPWNGQIVNVVCTSATATLTVTGGGVTPTGTTHGTTTVDGLSSMGGIFVGDAITDSTNADIPANTTVAALGTNAVTLSQSATGSHVGDTITITHKVANAPASCGPTTPFAMKFDAGTWQRYR